MGLTRAVAQAHRQYAAFVNARHGWTGHLFQSRFASVAMNERHLVSAARYVLMNPVRARLVARPQDWRWSSVHAHLAGEDDRLVRVAPLRERIEDFAELLENSAEADGKHKAAFLALRRAEIDGGSLLGRGQVMVSHGAAPSAALSEGTP